MKLDKSAIIHNDIYYFNNSRNKNIIESNNKSKENLIEDIYQSPVGLRMLNINNNDIGVQFGCNPSSLLFYAKNVCSLMAVVDDSEKLLYFNKQIQQKNRNDNILLINNHPLNDECLNSSFDFAIISSPIKRMSNKKEYLFLLKTAKNFLRNGGKLYFEINNKNYYSNFIFSKWPFINRTTYLSENEHIRLLIEAGFVDLRTYAVFPNKNYPQRIYPMSKKNNISYQNIAHPILNKSMLSKVIRRLRLLIDNLIFKKLKLYTLSPSFITIGISKYSSNYN